jgi:pyruvate formate lyase activating enzyme
MDNFSEVVTCNICERGCLLSEGKTSPCGNYTLKKGIIRELNPHQYLLVCPISVETMPILHFFPKGKFLQVTTTGCNFHCPGCVSTAFVHDIDKRGNVLIPHSPEELIAQARKEECLGITFLMNDPLASYFTFHELAIKAKAHGLLVGCATNGYFIQDRAEEIADTVDFINLGMKGFSCEDYKSCGASSLVPILNNLEIFHRKNVHVEISCMFRKGGEKNVTSLAYWLKTLDPRIPLQLMRYIPLEEALPEWEPTFMEAEKLCRELREIIPYVFLFNTPGTELLHTHCPDCGEVLVERDFYGPMGAKVKSMYLDEKGKCPGCGLLGDIVSPAERQTFREKGFAGGYPFTRALEMRASMLIAMGVTEKRQVVSSWEELLKKERMMAFHKEIQSPRSYIDALVRLGAEVGAGAQAFLLADYLQEKLDHVHRVLEGVSIKPRVLYVMGGALFALKGERFENQLVKEAGGFSLNGLLEIEGRPGESLNRDLINNLNPEVIFISSFLGKSAESVYKECRDRGINVSAVREKKIFSHPYPNIDFGSPRWILGLIYIAEKLHPGIIKLSLEEEAEYFYSTFYGCPFDASQLNRSFGKPHRDWNWSEKELHIVV